MIEENNLWKNAIGLNSIGIYIWIWVIFFEEAIMMCFS